MRDKIFISHCSTDKNVADMLMRFLVATGIPRDRIKCSSLPGNDAEETISPEIWSWLCQSAVNIAILSRDYYRSVYCLNEAGVLWYLKEVPVIPIGLPEIGIDDMKGFLDKNYKMRRLNSSDDAAYIYDTVREHLDVATAKHSIVSAEIDMLKASYARFCSLKAEEEEEAYGEVESSDEIDEDDISEDGYHERRDGDGNLTEAGQYENGKLIDGTHYNILLRVGRRKQGMSVPVQDLAEDGYDEYLEERLMLAPVKAEDLKDRNWEYSECGRYQLPFIMSVACDYVRGLGVDYFYVVDKKVKPEGKRLKPTFTNFRTLESQLAANDPDELDYLKTGVWKYDETDSAEIEI